MGVPVLRVMCLDDDGETCQTHRSMRKKYQMENIKFQNNEINDHEINDIKDTSYVWGKKQQNLQLLYILASNSANLYIFQTNLLVC